MLSQSWLNCIFCLRLLLMSSSIVMIRWITWDGLFVYRCVAIHLSPFELGQTCNQHRDYCCCRFVIGFCSWIIQWTHELKLDFDDDILSDPYVLLMWKPTEQFNNSIKKSNNVSSLDKHNVNCSTRKLFPSKNLQLNKMYCLPRQTRLTETTGKKSVTNILYVGQARPHPEHDTIPLGG